MYLLGEARYREFLVVIGTTPDDIEKNIALLKRFDVRLPPQAEAAKSLI